MIKFKDLFPKFKLSKVKLSTRFAELEFNPISDDQDAAWEMYVELVTRIITQKLEPESGDEKTALDSIYTLFATTRNVLKARGRNAAAFTKVAVIILNQIVRPFTAKWHKISLAGGFSDSKMCAMFRQELELLQTDMRSYASLLADMAGVEDLTEINDEYYNDIGQNTVKQLQEAPTAIPAETFECVSEEMPR